MSRRESFLFSSTSVHTFSSTVYDLQILFPQLTLDSFPKTFKTASNLAPSANGPHQGLSFLHP